MQVTFGNSSGSGLPGNDTLPVFLRNTFSGNAGDTQFVPDPTDPSLQPTLVANGLPGQVPILSSQTTPPVPDSSTNTQVTGTSAVPAVTNPVPTSSFSLSGYLASVFAAPGQHLIAVAVLLLLAFWLYKHVLKKF